MHTDVLVIGCGIGGAVAALELAADRQRQITLITRADEPDDSSSSWAQGGIVSLGEDDSAAALVEDILAAGVGLSHPPAVELLAEQGPALLERLLIEQVGVEFDRDATGSVQFGLEAAHSRRRILHAGDATGQAIMEALLRRVAEQPNIALLTGYTAVDLITYPHHARDPLRVYGPASCHGVYVLDQATGEVAPIVTPHTVLASGGLGQIFLNTSNPSGSRGDGVAMAYRAGAAVANCEYVQFHPTTLHMPGTTKFLISEAVRGEGAKLLTPAGDPFVERYVPEGAELAPRDLVARAIYWEMLAHDWPYVLLDIASQRSPDYIRGRFGKIHDTCLEHNIDITRQPIPVVPAAHYFCGGVRVDLWGRTSLPGLHAVGEVSCSGVHGANRLASTSLLEGVVWGHRAAADIRNSKGGESVEARDVPPWDVTGLTRDADPALIQGDMQTIRNLMWHYVGLARVEYRLNRAIRELTHLLLNIEDFYRKARLSDSLLGLRNGVASALLVARAAHRNRTSRGCHYREDARPVSGGSPPEDGRHLFPGAGPR